MSSLSARQLHNLLNLITLTILVCNTAYPEYVPDFVMWIGVILCVTNLCLIQKTSDWK
jgi:hypothetical protein